MTRLHDSPALSMPHREPSKELPLVSFVIPAFNAAPYIRRCLDSILGQPVGNFEVVVVDDGSTDDTGAIVREYVRRDERIRAFTQANGGQGSARNFGLTQARGEYIWFVDSDDWLFDGVLARIANMLRRLAPDVAVLNFASVFPDGTLQPAPAAAAPLNGRIISPAADAQTFASVSCWNTPPWRLLSRRALLVDAGIRFATGVFYEDHPFAIDLMFRARRVYVDPPVSYAYFQRPGSTTRANDRKVFDFLTIRKSCIELFRTHEATDRFPGLVATYILPLGFFRSHVPQELQREFLERLRSDLSQEDVDLVQSLNEPAYLEFLKWVRTGSVPRHEGADPYSRLLRGLRSPSRAWRAMRRTAAQSAGQVRAFGRRAASRAVARLRSLVAPPGVAVGTDATAAGRIVAGPGTRLEGVQVDVRVAPEDRPYLEIGRDCQVGGMFVFERGVGKVRIGDRASVGYGCLLVCSQEAGISIGSHVMLSWNVTVTDTDAHSLDPEIRANDAYDWKCGADAGTPGAYKDWSLVSSRPVTIEDGAWIGFGASILKGVTIGRGAVVGAGSVVRHDVAPYTIVAGNPARFMRYVPRERWQWADIVKAAHGDPSMAEILRDSYLHKDVAASVGRFHASEEFKETLKIVRELAPDARRILDIGAGNGVMGAALAVEGYQVVVVEPDDDDVVGTGAFQRVLDDFKSNGHGYLPDRVEVLNMPIEAFESVEPFDVAYLRQIVHHFQDPVFALKIIHRCLRPGGLALLVREHVVFDQADLDHFLEMHPFHRFYGGEGAYAEAQYLAFAQAAGFEVLRVIRFADSPINYFPHSRASVEAASEADVPGRPYTFVLRKPEVMT